MGKINVRDKGVHCKDAAMATIEVVPFSARFPCPECGKESKLHRARNEEEADIGDVLRICSNKACRHIYDAKGIKAKPSAPHRFPCFHCKCETKVDAEDRTQRICPRCGQTYRDDLIPE
jgi:predicted RNA-binding Zn-ribbon protein involved in translation (DUF1610 family)